MKNFYLVLFAVLFIGLSCAENRKDNSITIDNKSEVDTSVIFPGAYSTSKYIPLLKNKNVALVVNQSSLINETHLLDTLTALGITVKKIFSPEHGFRGKEDAGKTIDNTIDKATGVSVVSLYGKKRKPTREDLKDIDIIIFDIQDVGVRFYTYISTMGLVMEAAAQNDIPFIVLDRPNPVGYLIDGPMLEEKYKSFVGMYPIPIAYGMTIGELAKMIKGEKWIENAEDLDLTVVPCVNYRHDKIYNLPVKPSPNLPDLIAVTLYPSLCLFEGTTVSVGRGTDKPFKQIGHPGLKDYFKYYFVPEPTEGAKNPKHNGEKCYGIDLSGLKVKDIRFKNKLDLSYLVEFYKKLKNKDNYFLKNNWIDKLAGTDQLKKMIIAGKTEDEIRASWKKDLDVFKGKREKYLIYK